MPNEQELVDLITRGLEAAKERHALMSERVLKMELQFEQVSKAAEMQKLQNRIENLESHAAEAKTKQAENAKWIKGLLASVIMLLLGFLLNFIRIGLR